MPTDALSIQAQAQGFGDKLPGGDEMTDTAEVTRLNQERSMVWAVFSPVVPDRMRRMLTARIER